MKTNVQPKSTLATTARMIATWIKCSLNYLFVIGSCHSFVPCEQFEHFLIAGF